MLKHKAHKKYKLDYKNPYDITITTTLNDLIYSPEEIDNSKVNLNGLYGIPALRPYFNLFRINDDGDYFNIKKWTP